MDWQAEARRIDLLIARIKTTYIYIDNYLLCAILFWVLGHGPPRAGSLMRSRRAVSSHFSRGSHPLKWSYLYTGRLIRRKCFVCHSCEISRGVPSFFPFWNDAIPSAAPLNPISLTHPLGGPSRTVITLHVASCLESTLVKLQQDIGLYLALESTLVKKLGGRGSTITSSALSCYAEHLSLN